MSWKLSGEIENILKKGADFAGIDPQEAMTLMRI